MRRILTTMVGAALALALTGCDPWSQYGPLQGEWSYGTNGTIAAKPAVSNGTVYMGSWDGNEYALDEQSGALRWISNLGVTHANCPDAESQGITSSPALDNGVAYLGGGGSTWDALDTSTGNVIWTVPTGDNSVTGGHYNWSSPVVYNGEAYVGIASFCDSPLVQGELLRVNLATHQIDNVFKVVPDGQLGGTIWTNPVIDPSTNTVYIATGNEGGPNQPYAQAIVALDATTLAVKDSWTIPAKEDVGDADFATSPVLFTDSHGRDLVAITNKNGILYALDRAHLSAGPVWQTTIAAPADSCFGSLCGGSFSTGVFDGSRLYFASGATLVGGWFSGGSLRAIDPDTGAFVWEHALPDQVYGALAQGNGMIVVPSYDGGLYLIRGTDGTVVYANMLESGMDAPPTIADGSLFVGTVNGVVHAFRFPSSATIWGAHAARASTRGQAISCAGARPAGLTAHCLVTVAGRARCTRLGELPSALGAVALDRITVRTSGGQPRSRLTVQIHLNGSCAGTARFVIRVRRGAGTLRFSRARILAPGTVASVSASRAARIDLHVTGHIAGTTAHPAPQRRLSPEARARARRAR